MCRCRKRGLGAPCDRGGGQKKGGAVWRAGKRRRARLRKTQQRPARFRRGCLTLSFSFVHEKKMAKSLRSKVKRAVRAERR